MTSKNSIKNAYEMIRIFLEKRGWRCIDDCSAPPFVLQFLQKFEHPNIACYFDLDFEEENELLKCSLAEAYMIEMLNLDKKEIQDNVIPYYND